MTEDEYIKSVIERFNRYLRELGFKTREEQDREALEGAFDRLTMPPEQRAKELHDAGLSVQHIAVCLGFINKDTVHRMLNPESRKKYNERMKLYMRAYRARNKQQGE